jgi:hypothetical protein
LITGDVVITAAAKHDFAHDQQRVSGAGEGVIGTGTAD